VTATADPRRALLLDLLDAGLAAVDGRRRMREALARRDDLGGAWLLAVGKAASAMTLGALDALGSGVARALVISRPGHFAVELERDRRVRCLAGGHPVPDAGSLAAGAAALAMAREAPPGQPVLLLVSGGASSLLEWLPEGVSLGDLQRVSSWALGSGLAIGRVNAVRRALSELKDGRLLARFGHCAAEGYFISDVPGNDPAVVGSGLLARQPGAAALADPGLPPWIRELMSRSRPAGAGGLAVPLHCVGRLEEALDAIERCALAAGLEVARHAGRIDCDAIDAARHACGLAQGSTAKLYLFGGETTVRLPDDPGRGGRNQHLALAAAMLIAGRPDVLVLAAGSDGSDGNTDDAGALVDGGTLERGRDAGLDPEAALQRADSGRFLEASGDLVHTGPTGTNVGDVLLLLRREPGHSRDTGTSM
jgi:hydroxypyruvate reductase